MPSGLKRHQSLGHYHFVNFSCYHWQPYLTPDIRSMVEEVLEETRQRFELVVLGYVVMPEHVHLLVSEPERQTLADAIHWLKLTSSRRAHELCGAHVCVPKPGTQTWATPWERKRGHTPWRFWQTRYYDFNVFSDKKRVEKLNYMHRNSVKRGLVENPEDWLWSSYRWYAFGEQRAVKLNTWKALEVRQLQEEQ
jgi:putative transposase